MTDNLDTTELKRKKLAAGLAMVAVCGVIVGSIVAFPSKQDATMTSNNQTASGSSSSSSNQTSSSTGSAAASQTSSTTSYKDGTYSATGSYSSPGGEDAIDVKVTLKDNIVTSSQVTSDGNNNASENFIESFVSYYQPYVVGKNINDISFANVSGSTLTQQGFLNAIQQIENKAKA